MKLLFDSSSVNISLNKNPLTSVVQGMYYHLQHLPVNFKPWDNPFYFDQVSREKIVTDLVEFGKRLGIAVDHQRCLEFDQTHFNDIHKIYEQHYDGNPQWLDFHEHIHMCERRTGTTKTLVIDHREKAGLLEKKFNIDWMKDTVTNVKTGDVYIRWAELGKTPYVYWKNREPNNLDRICELAKPWIKLRPKLTVALEDYNFFDRYNIEEFNHWWKDYEKSWCQYWNIPSWSITDIASVSVIGKVDQVELLKSNLQKQIVPLQVKL
jgi:hypothetical protein